MRQSRYVNDGNVFQGTDRLSMAVQPDAEKFFERLLNSQVYFDEVSYDKGSVNVIFEGDRLFNGKLLDKLSEWFPESLKVLVLTASHDIKEQRHVDRKDDHDDKFKNSRATKISNITGSLTLMDYIDTMVNENLDDQSKIIDNIKSFFHWSE